MRKRIVLISVLTGCIIFGGLIFIVKLNNKNESKDIIVVSKTTIQNSEETIEPKLEEAVEEKIEESTTIKVEEENKTSKQQETKNNNSTTKTTKLNVVESTTSKTTTTKKVEEEKVAEKVVEPKDESKKETEEKPIWEYFNMTEYEYYNEPMYKWEKVDFAVSKYGSEKACQDACMAYGYEYEPYKNGEVSFICSTVNTASGKYLGEWFHTEKLIR